jgi:hypothetical protein
MRWRADATSCNDNGPFDAAYEFGLGVDPEGFGAGMTGTPEEIGKELARFLSVLTRQDVETMKYGTGRYYVELILGPVDEEEEG